MLRRGDGGMVSLGLGHRRRGGRLGKRAASEHLPDRGSVRDGRSGHAGSRGVVRRSENEYWQNLSS